MIFVVAIFPEKEKKCGSVLFNLQEKHFFYFIEKIAKKNSHKINQSQYHVINSDNMLQMRNTKFL